MLRSLMSSSTLILTLILMNYFVETRMIEEEKKEVERMGVEYKITLNPFINPIEPHSRNVIEA